jgi:site-specific recombinase XerD
MARTKGSKPPPARTTYAKRADYPDARHPVRSYLVGLGDDSERVTLAALDSVADILSGGKVTAMELAWHGLRHGHVNALRGRLQQLYAPATANRYLSALKAVLRESWRLGWLDRETLEKTIDVKGVKGQRELRGRSVSRAELATLFEACAKDPNQALGARDAAILALLYGVGLRRAEAAALEVSDFKPRDQSLRIRGKGNKQRIAYIPAGAQAALEAWLNLRGRRPGGLFCGVTKGGKLTHRDVTAQLIYRVVQKRHLAAGIAGFTPHDLRRSHISDLLDEGVDLAVIARQVGHSNVQTTARYDRRGRRAQRVAAERLDVPFGRARP